MNIYVDGCSYTAGYNLDPAYSLANLVATRLGASVVDKSRVGKSNYAMALDLHNTKEKFDFYIIGWTFNARIEFNLDSHIIDSAAARSQISLGDDPNGEYLENEYAVLQNRFFKYASRLPQLSDYFVDASVALLAGSKHRFFSWESRNTTQPLLYPAIAKEYRQQDTPNWQTAGHLTEQGMIKLTDMLLDYDK